MCIETQTTNWSNEMKLESPNRERLLTTVEVAEMLGIAEGTLRTWRCTKRYPLAYVKAGGMVRYKAADVAKFIDSRTESCEAVPA